MVNFQTFQGNENEMILSATLVFMGSLRRIHTNHDALFELHKFWTIYKHVHTL